MANRKSHGSPDDTGELQEQTPREPDEQAQSPEAANAAENTSENEKTNFVEIEKNIESPQMIALRKLWFLAANRAYRFCYFIGLQLLRSTRKRRRRWAGLLHAAETTAKERSQKKLRILRDRLRKNRRDFLSPVQEIRTHYRAFSVSLENARRNGAEEQVRLLWLNTMRLICANAWRAARILLNYAAPIAACIFLFSTLHYFNGLTLALHVTYNGVDVGYIANESVFTQAENDMKDRMILGDVMVADPTENDSDAASAEETSVTEIEKQQSTIIPQFTLTAVDNRPSSGLIGSLVRKIGFPVMRQQKLSAADELANSLIRAIGRTADNPDGFAIEQAAGLYIDGAYIGAVTNGEELLNMLYTMKERSRTADMGPDTKIQFVKKVQVKQGLYPASSLRELDAIRELLNKEERGKKIYTVVSGDTPLRIAAKNGISLVELKGLNPGVDISLMPGDQLMISNSVPYLGVKATKTIQYEEEVAFKIKQKTDAAYDIGYTKVLEKGEKGINEITAQVVLVDGVETERTVLNTKTIQEPVDEVWLVGGNRPVKVIPTDSGGTVAAGAFAWPADVHNIGTGYLGYWGHTGSDIVWNGCTGAPIYASADGVVVAAGWGGMYGYRVIINHGGGVQTLYAHCSQLYVGVGESVSQGQTIGAIGRTGNVTGPHLHFEIRLNGAPVNAAPYLYGQK